MKWRVEIPVGTSVFVSVEADDEDAAVEAAAEEMPSLCAHCSGWGKHWSRDEWEPDWDAATARAAEEGA